MQKMIPAFLAALAMTGCMEATHPATTHECEALRLESGMAAYNDCMMRMKESEHELNRAQQEAY